MAEARARFSAVLSNSGFLLLWMGQLLSQLADRIFVYILMIVAYSLTHTNLGVAIPMLAFGIPSVLFGSVAGVFADRLDRKGIMVVSGILRGSLVLLIIPLVSKSLPLIFVITFLIYTVAQFFAPAETSSIPELVEKKNLIVANSLFMITWMGASVMGIGLGAPLVHYLQKEGTFVLSAVFYFVSAALILLIPLGARKVLSETQATRSILGDLLRGFKYISKNVIVLYALLKLFISTSALAVVSLLAISYAKDVLMIGAENFGYLIIAVGLGMFVGLAFLGRLSHYFKKGTIVIFSLVSSGVFLCMLSLISDIRWALLLIFMLGVGNILVNSTIQTVLQAKVPSWMRGRVFGVQNMLINSAFTFPLIVFGIIADFWGVNFTLQLLGAMVVLSGFLGVFSKKFRGVDVG
ncbi:MFS transporter [Candidatus Margulisiibacteriota bacterium]